MGTKRPANGPPVRVNQEHISAFTHHFTRLGINEELAGRLSQFLGNGLWNRQQDDFLAMIAGLEKSPTIDTERVGLADVSRILRRTERAHATVFYHAFIRIGLRDQDAGKFARYFGRNLSNPNCDRLKALLMEVEAGATKNPAG